MPKTSKRHKNKKNIITRTTYTGKGYNKKERQKYISG